MKLENIEITQKKKKKKAIVIGVSTAAVLTLSGVAGWLLFKDGNNDIIQFAQSVISGSSMKDTLADNSPVEVIPDLEPEEILSLESYLKALGFVYKLLLLQKNLKMSIHNILEIFLSYILQIFLLFQNTAL